MFGATETTVTIINAIATADLKSVVTSIWPYVEIENIKAASNNLEQGVDDDVEFQRRLQIAELHLKEKDMDMKYKQQDKQQNRDADVVRSINES